MGVLSRSDGGQGVELVVHACQPPGHVAYDLTLEQHVKVMRLATGTEVAHRSAKTAYLAPAALAEHALQALFEAIDHHTPAVRYGAQQVMELALNGRQVVEDICVVELDIVDHADGRAVVQKLAPLVEERRIVLVTFRDKNAAIVMKFGRDRAAGLRKITRYATNEVARLASRALLWHAFSVVYRFV